VNNQIITSVENGTITIPTKSRDIILTAYVFNKSNLSNNLAGLSNLTNLQCTVTLTATTIIISRGDEIIWSGTKDCDEKLWNLAELKKKPENSPADLSIPHPTVSCLVLQTIRHDTIAEFVAYVHAVFMSCPLSTFFMHSGLGGWTTIPRLHLS
jgi:hypothetical protein